jgi:hypothetical protein
MLWLLGSELPNSKTTRARIQKQAAVRAKDVSSFSFAPCKSKQGTYLFVGAYNFNPYKEEGHNQALTAILLSFFWIDSLAHASPSRGGTPQIRRYSAIITITSSEAEIQILVS